MTTADSRPWGGVARPDAAFLARAAQETALEPERPIIDTHLDLWHLFDEACYLVPQHATDILDSGHHIVGSVFVECSTFYRVSGPDHLKSVGETEFAAG